MKKLLIALLILIFPVLSWAIDITILVPYEKNKHRFGSTLNWKTDVIKVDLVSDTPDVANDEFYDDCTSATAGPVTLTSCDAAADSGTGDGTLTAANATITATGTWRYFVVMKWVTAAADSPLLFYGDAGEVKAAGTYILDWSGAGIVIRIQ